VDGWLRAPGFGLRASGFGLRASTRSRDRSAFFLEPEGRDDNAQLIVAKASRSAFQPICRYVVAHSATWAQPTISGNRIIVKDVMSLALFAVD
jgi:hypothetical protein